jgi:hypothetical protein
LFFGFEVGGLGLLRRIKEHQSGWRRIELDQHGSIGSTGSKVTRNSATFILESCWHYEHNNNDCVDFNNFDFSRLRGQGQRKFTVQGDSN